MDNLKDNGTAAPETLYPLTSLYLYLTDQCNLLCGHCWISPGFSRNRQSGIPIGTLKKTILNAKRLGLNNVKLTGGEPLLYKDLDELLAFLAAEGLSIYIETNGTLIDRDMLESFQLCKVRQVFVSLDAASETVYDAIRGVRGGFQQTMAGLRLLSKSSVNFQIIMTLQRKNRNQIPDVIQLSKMLGAGSLKINPLIPSGRGRQSFEQKENLELKALIRLFRMVEDRPRPDSLEIIFDLPAAFHPIENLKLKKIKECRILNILGVLANGDFSICGIGQTVDKLRMGNLSEDTIQEVWSNSPILRQLRQSVPRRLKGVCGHCIFRFQCLGSCRANAFALTGSLQAPYFLCQELFESDLFPSSRYID